MKTETTSSRSGDNIFKGQIDRRGFLSTLSGVAAAAAFQARAENGFIIPPARRPQIALIATEIRKHSHAQHFIDRLVEGYGWQGQWHHPSIELASLYVDQFPENDLARERSIRFKIPIYPTVEEALTLGASKVAVDGIIIIGEHGNYPRNQNNQTLYPRYKWFKQVVNLFKHSGRSVPVFSDKHLSTDWLECVEMVNDSKLLSFPFLAGSSLPVTWRIPSVEMPLDSALDETVVVCYGGVDSYDFHGIETAQCMSERRKGHETGLRSVQALRGEKLWAELAKNERTRSLFVSALCRSHTLQPAKGYTVARPGIDLAQKVSPEAIGYFMEHNDGFKTSVFLCDGLVRDFTCASGFKDNSSVLSCQMEIPMPTQNATTADFFNPLVHHIETMMLTKRAPYPVERTLLTSGMTLAAVDSLVHQQQARVETPQMNVRYSPVTESTFWRA